MSAPLHRQLDENESDASLYAPPWARERPLPAAGQPQLISSPPVASAAETSQATTRFENPQSNPEATSPPTWAPRMPKGVGGPNIDCPPHYQVQPEFAGDIAMRALRRKLALEPDVVPQPPIIRTRDRGFPWITSFGFVCMAAGIAGFVVAFLATSESQQSASVTRDRPATVSADNSATSGERAGTPARLVLEDIKVVANEPLPLGVSLHGALGGEFILLAGLAAGTRLTAGAPVGSKGWRVMARDLGSVLAYAPRDYIGAMDAAIDLRSAGDTLLDSQVVRLEWTSKNQGAAQPVVAVRSPARELEAAEIARLVRRGQQYMQAGDVAVARLMLRRAAEAGSAEAALGLGATFDPAVLREIGVLGFAPNVAQARQWYQKAAELGSGEASRRIERLRDSR